MIGDIQAVKALDARSSQSAAGTDAEQAARNREVLRAVREVNEAGGVGPSSELRFAVDQGSGHPLIRIVDRVTQEVINQIPAEAVLRLAEVLKRINAGERIG